MGNTPTQQPFEGDSSEADESPAGASLGRRVASAVHSFVDGVRRRLSVFSGLDFGRDRRVEDDSFGTTNRLPGEVADDPTTTRPRLPGPDATTTSEFPKRDRPLTQPVRDRKFQNAPDLEATEDGGRLSIYYPDCEDATITSDTWERVRR